MEAVSQNPVIRGFEGSPVGVCTRNPASLYTRGMRLVHSALWRGPVDMIRG